MTTWDHSTTATSEESRGQVSTTVHLKQVSKTKLPNNRNSLLVDLGSRINLVGKLTEREMSLEAERNGHQTFYEKRKHTLHVNGVGKGSAPCNEKTILPIAVPCVDRKPCLESFKADIAEDCGEALPAILGSESMQDKDSVLLLRREKESLVFPGPGGYKIIWSPGTRIIPMQKAPSGHLVIACDHFQGITETTPNPEALTFLTDHATGDWSNNSHSNHTTNTATFTEGVRPHGQHPSTTTTNDQYVSSDHKSSSSFGRDYGTYQ